MFSIYKGAIEASQTGIVQHGPGHEGSHHWYHLQSISEVNRLQSSNNATRQHSAGVFTLLLLPLQSSDCATQHEHISFVTFCIVFLCILRNQTVLDIFLFKMYPSAPSNCQRTSLHPYASYIILWRVEHILYHKTFIKVGSMNLIW